jgi:hypothetical protein
MTAALAHTAVQIYYMHRLEEKVKGFPEAPLGELPSAFGIRKPIRSITGIESSDDNAGAVGTAHVAGFAGIALSPRNFAQLQSGKEVQKIKFLVGHELSHIKHDDNIFIKLVGGVAGVITGFLVKRTLAPIEAFTVIKVLLIYIAVSMARRYVENWYSRRCEKRADLEGFSVCSRKEQEEEIKLFRNAIKENLRRREILLLCNQKREADRMFSPEGDTVIDTVHPKLSERVRYLENEMLLMKQFPLFRRLHPPTETGQSFVLKVQEFEVYRREW